MPTLPYKIPSRGLSRVTGLYPTVLIGGFFSLVLALWVATQVAAAEWAYKPELGEPWIWRIYYPWKIIVWSLGAHGDPTAAAALWPALKAFFVWLGVGVLCTLGSAFTKAKQYEAQSDIKGSGKWGTEAVARAHGLLGHFGILLGNIEGTQELTPIWDAGPAPALVVGPNRSGKGRCFVIPNLLLNAGMSAVVFDPKGENWERTAGYLQGQGHLVMKIDPTDVTATPWNGVLEMPEYPQDVAFAQNLARALRPPLSEHQTKGDPHWELTADEFIAAVLLHVFYAEQEKTFTRCWQIMVDPTRDIGEIFHQMGTAAHDPTGKYKWTDPMTGQPTKTHPNVQLAVGAMQKRTGGDRTSVVSTAEAYFGLFRDPVIQQNTQTCGVRVQDLLDESLPPITIYLTTPLFDQERVRSFLRLFFFQLWRVVSKRDVPRSVGWGLSQGGPRQLFLPMDEYAVLGKMETFEAILPNLASLGVKVALIVQTPAQMRTIHGQNGSEAIMDNCTVKVFFRPEGTKTAADISRMCGTMTVTTENLTYTGHRWSFFLPHVIAGISREKRNVLEEDEVLRLDDRSELVIHKGVPYLALKIPYDEDIVLSERSAIPPPVWSDCVLRRSDQWQETASTQKLAWNLR